MKFITLQISFFCLLPCLCWGQGLGAANVVGFKNADHRHGVHVNMLVGIGGGPSKLGDIVSRNVEGAELRFNDGSQWCHVKAEQGDDGNLHWYDIESGECADDYTVPEGQSIMYDVPDDAEEGLTFVGQVPERLMGKGDMGPLFTDGPALSEIRLKPQEVLKIMGYSPPVVTNQVIVTNQPASRFVVRMKDNTERHARYNFALMRIDDAIEGTEIDVSSDAVLSFEVETNANVAVCSRMSRKQVSELQRAYVREFRLTRDKREQDNAAKGVEQALFSWNALWKWFLATAGAVVVGIIVSALCRMIWSLFLRGLTRVRFWYYKLKGMRLYRRMMRKRRERAPE